MALGKKNGGWKKGSKNKHTKDFKATLEAFVENQLPIVIKAFAKLRPRERVNAYLRFMEYVTPKYSALTVDVEKLPEQYWDRLLELAEKRMIKKNEQRENPNINRQFFVLISRLTRRSFQRMNMNMPSMAVLPNQVQIITVVGRWKKVLNGGRVPKNPGCAALLHLDRAGGDTDN